MNTNTVENYKKTFNIPKNEYINLIIRLVVGFVFVITGIGKIIEPAQFAKDISNYDMLFAKFVNLVAIFLPWIEIIVGFLFVFGIRVKANIILLFSMLIVFNIAVATAWARGLNIDCGCFGDVAQQNVGIEKLAENFAMIGGLIFMFFFPNNKFSLENFAKKED